MKVSSLSKMFRGVRCFRASFKDFFWNIANKLQKLALKALGTNCAHLSFLEFVPRMGVEMVSKEYKSRFVRKKFC